MTSPYINTKLKHTVALHPYQMDNKIYINLKKNLENHLVGKCFTKYGYVMKIIEILSYKDGIIEAEDFESSAKFDIEFSCRLCFPTKNMQIICEIDRLNKLMMTAKNGPILAIITNDRINGEFFYKDNNNNIRYKKDNQTKLLEEQDFIKVTIQSIKFLDGDSVIKVIGFLDDIATDEEKSKYYSDQYKDTEIVSFEQIA